MIEDDIKAALVGSTPGPWMVSTKSPSTIKPDDGLPFTESNVLLATTHGNDHSGFFPSEKVCAANTKLIAAAPELLTRALSEIESLRAERDAAMADARRYRYLRDESNWTLCSIHGMTRFAARLNVEASFEAESSDELDVMIDAAIAKGEAP